MKRLVLTVLPTTAAFGSLMPGLSSLFAFRLLTLALLVYAIFTYQRSGSALGVTRGFHAMAVIWVFVGLVGLFFVADVRSGVGELTSIFIGFGLIIGLLFLEDRQQTLRYLQQGWVVAFLITGAIGVREFLTGQHEANYFSGASLAGFDPRLLASVFGNPNAFAAFLVTALPMLVLGIVKAKHRAIRFAHGVMSFALFGLILYTGSRLGLVACLLQLVFFSLYAGPRYRRTILAGTILSYGALLLLGAGGADSLIAHLPDKASTAALAKMPSEILRDQTSANRRLNLYLDGLWMIGDTYGVGVGAGNFEQTIRSGAVPYDSGGVVDPHNVYLEVASQYGIAVTLPFFVWIIGCLRIFWRHRRDDDDRRWWSVAMLAALGGNAISGLANSSYLDGSVNWMFLATMMLVAVVIDGSSRTSLKVAARGGSEDSWRCDEMGLAVSDNRIPHL